MQYFRRRSNSPSNLFNRMGQELRKVGGLWTAIYRQQASFDTDEEAGVLLYPCNGVNCHVLVYHIKAEVQVDIKRCAPGWPCSCTYICNISSSTNCVCRVTAFHFGSTKTTVALRVAKFTLR
jgi:hypothetical protein